MTFATLFVNWRVWITERSERFWKPRIFIWHSIRRGTFTIFSAEMGGKDYFVSEKEPWLNCWVICLSQDPSFNTTFFFPSFCFLNIRINTTSTAWMNATRSCNRDVATWKREEWMHYHLIYHLFGSQLKYLHYVYHVAI